MPDTPPDDDRSASVRIDLRRTAVDDVIARVQQVLDVRLSPDGAVAKRRSLGFRSDRETWIRIECRGLDRINDQGWGTEATIALRGVPLPRWHTGCSWFDPDRRVMWRADETQLIDATPIGRSSATIGLPEQWWDRLDETLDALAENQVRRTATPDLEPISVERVQAVIRNVFPDAAVPLEEWTTAHADLTWANLTGPELWLLDWEDLGRAPRGLDAASLWFASLATPDVAERVLACRRADLQSASGRTMRLFKCAELLAWADETERLYVPARQAAEALAAELTI